MLSHSLLLYLSALFTGLERGGIPGLAPVAVTSLLAFAGSPGLSRRLIGVLIPVYCASDLTACYIYKESIRWDILRELVLPVAVGMFFSFLTLGSIDGEDVRTMLGLVLAVLLSILALISAKNYKDGQNEDVLPLTLADAADSDPNTPLRSTKSGSMSTAKKTGNSPSRSGSQISDANLRTTALSQALHQITRPVISSGVFRAFMGCAVGYLTVVANVSGLVLILMLLSMNLPLRSFNGTRSALLLTCNGCKLPGQLLLGTIQMTMSDVIIITPLIIASVVCTWATEKYIIHKMDQTSFENVIWLLVAFAAIKLIFIF
jgi:uncharacterized membrane protein YfcA